MFRTDGTATDQYEDSAIVFVPGVIDLNALSRGISEMDGPDPSISIDSCLHKSFSLFLDLIAQTLTPYV